MSTLNVDALVGNTSANAITVRGEGSATTSLQQGLCKLVVFVPPSPTTSIEPAAVTPFSLSILISDAPPLFCIASTLIVLTISPTFHHH